MANERVEAEDIEEDGRRDEVMERIPKDWFTHLMFEILKNTLFMRCCSVCTASCNC